jgi:nitronate monooxygenase
MNRLAALLGTEWPIVQAPMAGVQGAALAVAACQSGALGSLPAAMLTPESLRAELAALRAGAAGRPFSVNFFCHRAPAPDAARDAAWRAALAPYFAEYGVDPSVVTEGTGRAPFGPEHLPLLDEFRPAVVSFHFGLPAPALLAEVKALGCRVISTATTLREGMWLEAHGADAVIAQGLEAGGHRGMFLTDDLDTQLGTFALVPQLVRGLRVPVIAAGGIADAQGVAGAMALGAAGVQVGTAYLCSDEASTGVLHRAALAAGGTTAITNCLTGRPARGLVNRLMREIGPMSPLAPAFPLAAAALAPLRAAAEAQGRTDFSPLWAGQNTSGCRTVPAAEITRALAVGCKVAAR